ncbi:MAG: S41 family peptidase [Candidatus Saccharimonadales bacterium]
MVSETKKEGSTAPSVRPKRHFVRYAAGAIVLYFVFSLGVMTGNGQLHLTTKQGSTGLPDKLDYSSVNDVYNALKQNYNGTLTQQQVLDGIKHGLAEATNDPYTEYFTATEAKQFTNDINSTFGGIGAELGQDSDKNIIVISPITGFPADKAGLKAQDIIATIDGGSTQGMSIDQAVNKIRGPKGSIVKLGIVRGGATQTLSITRDTIQVPSVTSKILDNNIGYMQITSFANDTGDLAKKAADDFKQKNVKGIIVDLRNDPGGYLDAAVSVSSLWIPQGNLVVNEKGSSESKEYTATGGNILQGIPTVVLVNGGSASASEITAGALHDTKNATIIGEKSYGKGVVQQLINLSDGSQLKVTVASWYRPNGQNIQHKGITPDQIVTLTDDDAKAGNDTQLTAAEAFLNK